MPSKLTWRGPEFKQKFHATLNQRLDLAGRNLVNAIKVNLSEPSYSAKPRKAAKIIASQKP